MNKTKYIYSLYTFISKNLHKIFPYISVYTYSKTIYVVTDIFLLFAFEVEN